MVQKTNAATFTVTNTNDSGTGSLRQAILDANVNNENDSIVFDSTVFSAAQTITLTSGELGISPDNSSGSAKTLTINGVGANLLTINGNNQSRILYITPDSTATINNIKLTGGNGLGSLYSTSGGAVLIFGAGVTLNNLYVTGNNAYYGGGIYIAGGTVTVNNSTIANNTAGFDGGGIFTSGVAPISLRLINSTVSHNVTGSVGGGIQAVSTRFELTNSTIAFNQVIGFGSRGGGVNLDGSSASVRMRNSIIASNKAPIANLVDISGGSISSEGYNIFGVGPAVFIEGDTATNQYNTDPQLDTQLSYNGGAIPVLAFRSFSPAIDRGSNCVLNTPANGGCLEPNLTTDARGTVRPQDGDGNGTAIVDIGAFEGTRDEIVLGVSAAAPDLQAANDTGISNTDNITLAASRSFNLSGLTIGATIELLRNDVVVASAVADNSTMTFTDSQPVADGTFQYRVRQRSGNVTSLPSSALTVVIDRIGPFVSIDQAQGQADPTKILPVNFIVQFNEAIYGLDAGDISFAGSTANVSSASVTISGSGLAYNAAVGNVTADGVIQASVLPNAVQDIAGNPSIASTTWDNTVTLDTTSPSVTINQSAGQIEPTRNLPINFTVVFSEPVIGLQNTDISLAGSTANVQSASISITGTGTTYNVAVSSISSNGGYVRATVLPTAAVDPAGNLSLASTSTDNTVTIDNTAPTVTLNQAAGQPDPTNTLPVNFTVVFSEPVTGFDSSDISFSGSSVNTAGATVVVTGSGTTYNVAVSNIVTGGGILRATVNSSAATDSLGNFSFASTSNDNQVSIDTVAPTVSINQAIGQSDPSATQPVNFRVIFSELVTGFSASDISLAGSTANVSSAVITVTGSGNVYNVAVSNIRSSGQVRATVIVGAAQDAVGNSSVASTSTDNTINVTVAAERSPFDFDGDGKSDISVFRPNNGVWYLQQSTSGFTGVAFGAADDVIAPADYDGDGRTDIAVFRPSNGVWYLQQSTAGFSGIVFGASGDIPVPADFDGDGKADLAVFRPSNGVWYVQGTQAGFYGTSFGALGDKPVAADYDGDGKADIAVFRPSNGVWYLQRSQLGFTGVSFGDSADKAVPADYDGDGKADVAVFRPSNGTWYLQQSTAGFSGVLFGANGDLPVPADYDGDGKTDVSVFRPSNGVWYLNRSTQGFTGIGFGASTDKPIPNAFIQ